MIPNNHEVSLHKFLQVCQTAQVHKLQRHVHNHGALGHEPWESTNMGPPMINSLAVNIIYTYIYISEVEVNQGMNRWFNTKEHSNTTVYQIFDL